VRGIILAGGRGSRLWPATASVSKQLLPVAGRPMILFPLCTLMETGIREVCIITTEASNNAFVDLLGNGARFGMTFYWRIQNEPKGLPDAFVVARDFIGNESVTLILGDNIFIGLSYYVLLCNRRPAGAEIFAIPVANPKRYGVVTFDEHDRIASVREKPKFSSSRWAVAGLYSFAPSVVKIARELKPSARGEAEIVDVIEEYRRRGQLKAHKLPPSAIWMDAGTPEDLHEAGSLVMALEKRTGEVIGSPELTALRQGFISKEQFAELVRAMPPCQYRVALAKACGIV